MYMCKLKTLFFVTTLPSRAPPRLLIYPLVRSYDMTNSQHVLERENMLRSILIYIVSSMFKMTGGWSFVHQVTLNKIWRL